MRRPCVNARIQPTLLMPKGNTFIELSSRVNMSIPSFIPLRSSDWSTRHSQPIPMNHDPNFPWSSIKQGTLIFLLRQLNCDDIYICIYIYICRRPGTNGGLFSPRLSWYTRVNVEIVIAVRRIRNWRPVCLCVGFFVLIIGCYLCVSILCACTGLVWVTYGDHAMKQLQIEQNKLLHNLYKRNFRHCILHNELQIIKCKDIHTLDTSMSVYKQ